MSTEAISLRFAANGCWVRLRDITGHEERGINGTGTDDALQLLDALLLPVLGEGIPPRADDLVAADRDRLLVALYRQIFGDRIGSTLTCDNCSRPFDIDFSLRDLAITLESRPPNPAFVALNPNLFQAAEGWRFRLPVGRDERAVVALPAAVAESTLLERCCLAETGAAPDSDRLQAALEEVAPLFEFELKGNCPECGRLHSLQFDIQTFLLSSLLQEKTRLFSEIHRLAKAYGWGLNDVLSLSRIERRRLVEFIENEQSRRRINR